MRLCVPDVRHGPPCHSVDRCQSKVGGGVSTEFGGTTGKQLREAGCVVEICGSLEAVAHLSASLHASNQLRAVVAAGGDGTAAAVANLLPPDVPMAVFPLGTENLLARQLKLSADPIIAAKTILAGQTLWIDAGLANDRLFLVMLGCGFDAEVVAQMHRIRRGHINRWSYAKPIWQAIRNYSYPAIEVELLDCPGAEGGELANASRFSTAWLFAFNLPRYAADLSFCTQAQPSDGLLDLCAFKRGGLLRGLYYLGWLWFGMHHRLKDVLSATVSTFSAHFESSGSLSARRRSGRAIAAGSQGSTG